MMKNNEIEDYLSSFNISLEQSVYDQIQDGGYGEHIGY